MNTLDLRFNGKISSELSELFNQIALNNIEIFNKIISKVSFYNINNLNWWIKSPASRNTYSSPLFFRLTCLKLLDKLIDENKFNYSKVIVDSFEFAALIEDLLKQKKISKVTIVNNQYHSLFIKRIKDNFHKIKTSLFFILRFIIVKILIKNENIPSTIKVVDSFLMPNFVLKDRWYAGFFDNLSKKQSENLFFIPTVVNSSIIEFIKIILKLKNSKRKTILKESFLSFQDIIWITSNLFNNKFKSKNLRFLDLNITNLIIEEFKFSRDQLTIVESLSIYSLFKNFYKNKIKVDLAVDWFEGQSIDKAWSFSLNKFYPKCKTYAYRGGGDFSLHLCNYPILVEKEANVIPKTFLITGNGYKSLLLKYIKKINFIVVPSFRSLHVWDDTKKNLISNNNFKILVSLPISLIATKNILNILIKVNSKLQNLPSKEIFYIKVHPAFNPDNEFKSLCNKLPKSFSFQNDKDFNLLLKNCNLLISEASGTCLESIACGIPVLVIKNLNGFFYNPIPNDIPNDIFKFVSNAEDLLNNILYYNNNINYKKNIITSKKIKLRYFEPFNKNSIHKIFQLI